MKAEVDGSDEGAQEHPLPLREGAGGRSANAIGRQLNAPLPLARLPQGEGVVYFFVLRPLIPLLLLAAALLWATPFAWMAVASLRPNAAGASDIASLCPARPVQPVPTSPKPGATATFPSGTSTPSCSAADILLVQCVTVSLAGYAFARLRFPGRRHPVLRLPAATHAGAADPDRAEHDHADPPAPLRHAAPASRRPIAPRRSASS